MPPNVGVSSPGSPDSPAHVQHAPDQGAEKTPSVFLRLFREFAWPWRLTLAWALFWLLCLGATNVVLTYLAKPVIDGFDLQATALDIRDSWWIGLAIVAAFSLRSLVQFLGEYLLAKAGHGMVNDARKRTFDHLTGMDLAFFQTHPAGTLMSRLSSDTAVLSAMFSKVLICIGRDAPTLIGLIAVTFTHDWRLALIAYCVLPIAVWPITLIGRKVRRISKRSQARAAVFSASLVESLRGIRMIKLFGAEDYERTKVHGLINELRRLVFRAERTKIILAPLTELVIGIALGVVVIFGGELVFAGELTKGTLVSFLVAVTLAYRPAKSLANLHVDLQGMLASAERLYELLDSRPVLKEVPNARPLDPGTGRIQLENVSFTYGLGTYGCGEGQTMRPDSDRQDQAVRAPALQNVTLEISPGETIALVGPSGAGKSTITNMIMRLFDPTHGRVLIDGQDIRNVTLTSLWARMALVSQDVAIFDDTVRANIAYARIDADDAAVETAARMAAADEFIRALPDGYETQLGERGCTLSGGQRQRISIARAFLKNAPILLLDEPTSALDNESERLVQQSLKSLMQGRATLVIAHRLSTIREADRIYVMSGGRIVESGNHHELVTANGLYAQLLESNELGA